jgi:hypothetical protein
MGKKCGLDLYKWTFNGEWTKETEDGDASLIKIGEMGDFIYFKSKKGFPLGGIVFSFEKSLLEYLRLEDDKEGVIRLIEWYRDE